VDSRSCAAAGVGLPMADAPVRRHTSATQAAQFLIPLML
jgi:hypothetical protein